MPSLLPRLRVSTVNPHLLETTDGKPFFMLGDTAWELLHRLNLEEIRHYLDERKRQKFNMVWVNLLAEFDGIRQPDRNGELPLIDEDPRKPNERYFKWVDSLVEEAAGRGIYLGILPTWGDKVTAPWGVGPRIFRDPETAREYTKFLAQRYRDATNILWVIGGDRPPMIEKGSWMENYAKELGISPDQDWRPIWRAMAEGIQEVLGDQALMTYHPQGGSESTSRYLHHESWLHLNCMQSGHGAGRDYPVWEDIERDYNLKPVKPTFDGEPNYEDHPVSPWPKWDPRNGYYDEYDVRRQNWRSVFAGGCGAIYGHHSIWGFASHHNPWINHTKMPWEEALVRPGAEQMHILREFIESSPMMELVPDQTLFVGDIGEHGNHKRAIRSKDSNWVAVYLPHGGPVSLHSELVVGKRLSWLDPRTGKYSEAKADEANGIASFTPLNDIDWVLLLKK